ncbi:MAG: hypothetical protein AB7O66_12335 [Limisphaerales bacterium]
MRLWHNTFDNLSWKFLSLGLAVLIWYGAHLFMHDDIRPMVGSLQAYGTRDFPTISVRVLGPPNPVQSVRITPATILVRVGGDLALLERLTEQDPIVFVELPDVPIVDAITNRLEIRLPPSIRLVGAFPDRVVIRPPTPR